MDIDTDYTVKRIDDSLYPATVELYQKAFDMREDVAYVKAKYDTSRFGLAHTGFFAFHSSGEPAAFYGVFPMRFSVKGQDVLCAQSGDTMTAPSHTKKGLFIRLAKETYQYAEAKGVKFVFGFPNENSYPGFKNKLDWQFQGVLKKLTLKVNTLPLCEATSKFSISRGLYANYVSIVIAGLKVKLTSDSIAVFNHLPEVALVKKDLDFFEYKLRNPMNHLIKVNGFTMLIKPYPHLLIGAVNFFDKDKTLLFINTIKQLAFKLGCGKINLFLSENHWLYKYLENQMGIESSLPIGFYEIEHSIPYADITFITADMDTF
jgi:Acetyltransferase (GNAT) domain